jgi:hypothetical protein
MPTVKDVGEPGAGEPHARFDAAAGGIRRQWPQGPTVPAPPADPTATALRRSGAVACQALQRASVSNEALCQGRLARRRRDFASGLGGAARPGYLHALI